MLKRKLKSYAFILYPILAVFGIGLLIYYSPIYFIPDYLDIYSYSKTYELFSLIVGSLVSLIGVYVSVTIVAFEFFKQKTGVDFQRSFLVNPLSAYYISFTVLTILFSFISNVFISGSNPSNAELSLIYFNIFLFLAIILMLIPVSFRLFSSLRPEKFANKELSKINSETIFIMSSKDIDEQSEYIEQDSLLRIESVIIALIQVNDHSKASFLIQKVIRHLSNIVIDIDNIQDKDYVIDRMISFMMRIVDSTLMQTNNSLLLRGIWISTKQIYDGLIDRKVYSIHFKRFRSAFFERYFSRLFKADHDEMIFEGISCLRIIIQNQVLNNMPKDDRIHDLDHLRSSIQKGFKSESNFNSDDFKVSAHWREVSIEFMSILSFVINRGIILKKPDIVNKCFEEINDLNFNFSLKNPGIYKESFFLIRSSNIITDYAYIAFKKEAFLEGSESNHLTPALFEDLIKREHPAARVVLQKYCLFLIKLQKIGKLERWFLGGLKIGNTFTFFGELGEIAFRCTVEYKNSDTAKLCLTDCIDTYSILKEFFEENPPIDFGLYLCIKNRFENILDWLKEREVNADDVKQKLEGIINSFKSEKEMYSSKKGS